MADLLVFGRSGQLARALAHTNVCGNLSSEFIGRDAMDLARLEALEDMIEAHAPTLVINAAAYTAVDKAESEPDLAAALNHLAPAAMARVCAKLGAAFVHVSTDYVFGGGEPGAYRECDPRTPINVYGTTKAAGEDAVLASGARSAIVRTSWVYSAGDGNFVSTMLRLAHSRSEIGVVADQIGRPTWANDLARACLTLGRLAAEGQSIGVVHYAGGGEPVSWADFATEIFACAKAHDLPHANVNRITTADYPTPARRPANSVLDIQRYADITGQTPRAWREALELCMGESAQRQPS